MFVDYKLFHKYGANAFYHTKSNFKGFQGLRFSNFKVTTKVCFSIVSRTFWRGQKNQGCFKSFTEFKDCWPPRLHMVEIFTKFSSFDIFNGAMPRYWYFVGHFLCLSKLMLPYLKSIWQIILKTPRKNNFQRQLNVPSHKQTLLCSMHLEENIWNSFQEKHNRCIIDNLIVTLKEISFHTFI